MAHASHGPRFFLSLLFALLLASLPARVGAVGAANLPALEDFVAAVSNGDGSALRGIYVPGVLASWIVPQPEGEQGFIYSEENTLTQYSLAERFGSTGLLAHNNLAGRTFSRLQARQVFTLVYGDGRTESFLVIETRRFWALSPEWDRSLFVDLKQGDLLTASQLFLEVYARPGHVILQTCIEARDEPSWGRLFIVAEPYQMESEGSTANPDSLE